ncbi:LOW QUALITY PROTEIN: helicase POLQ-like [Chelonus insularis]|uniref:LOW QUALITY PROTEIN: helicase POLQ-like n=1 Tax=Chelonus insularis TaxID=460826 RepID=UPI00158A8835|nr:LOW QUALITY PROTEIN: helicase POLQ-like [Chelonus insularis]
MDEMCLDFNEIISKSQLVDILNESMSSCNFTEELINVTCLQNDILHEDFEWNETTWIEDGNGLSPFKGSSHIRENYEMTKPTIIEDFINEVDCFDESFERPNNFYGLPNEVEQLIKKVRNITDLYDWQHECLSLNAIKERRNLIYALPTSGGKTLVAEILMLKELLCNKRNAIFILPYVAIVQEKIQSMTSFALDLDFLIEEYAGGKGQYPPVKRRRKNTIYICTIEKASGLVNSLMEVGRLQEIGLVVVDELHLIGENGGRGATLEGLLTKLIYSSENIQIVGMSATIGNLEEIAKFLKADLYTQNFRPVQLKEYIKCGDSLWEIDPREEDLFIDEKKINYPYSDSARQIDPDKIGGLVMDVVPQHSCLIFCASRKNCENVALLLTRVLLKSLKSHKIEEKQKLLSDLKAEADVLCPILFKTIQYGVAYHHSGLTNEERRLIEDAFREGVISVICCTSTLAAGVNLPARRVILRSPYIGNEFLNLSRYKQMIGRAGRTGMGEIGESIVICQSSDIPKIRELLTSKIEDCVSTLNVEEDRGINNLILSSVMLSLATTRNELQNLIQSSLLNVQASKLNINIKECTDNAIIKLIKAQVLKIKYKPCYQSNMAVHIQSQMDNESNSAKKSIVITATSKLELSTLGKAAMKGCLDLELARILYRDLKTAQKHLILNNVLHLLYLVTPYELANQLRPVGCVYYDAVINLSPPQMEVAKILGIDEVAIMKIRDEKMPKNVEQRVINRFYLTLILYEIWQHQSMYTVAEKYQVNRGLIQNLLTSAASFSMSIVRLCQELPEFWVFTDLFTSFHKKLTYSNSTELQSLMELPAVKIGRARQLYNAGYKTLQSIATANPIELQGKVKNLSKKIVTRIIDAANLLLLEKMENLKEEVAEMMEGLDTCQRFTQNLLK